MTVCSRIVCSSSWWCQSSASDLFRSACMCRNLLALFGANIWSYERYIPVCIANVHTYRYCIHPACADWHMQSKFSENGYSASVCTYEVASDFCFFVHTHAWPVIKHGCRSFLFTHISPGHPSHTHLDLTLDGAKARPLIHLVCYIFPSKLSSCRTCCMYITYACMDGSSNDLCALSLVLLEQQVK